MNGSLLEIKDSVFDGSVTAGAAGELHHRSTFSSQTVCDWLSIEFPSRFLIDIHTALSGILLEQFPRFL